MGVVLKKDLRHYQQFFPEYTELRVQENRSVKITLVNGDVMVNNATVTSGISARVNKNSNWGFASNSIISDDAIKTVIASATANADFLGMKQSKSQQRFASSAASAANSLTIAGK